MKEAGTMTAEPRHVEPAQDFFTEVNRSQDFV